MTPTQQLIHEAAKANARLHFHPDYSKDAFTACEISFEAGANYALSTPELWREQWTKIDDGLPELETQVIVARPNKYSGKVDILMAYLHDSGEQGRSCGKLYEPDWLYGKYWSLPAVTKLNDITHWMPIPKPPMN